MGIRVRVPLPQYEGCMAIYIRIIRIIMIILIGTIMMILIMIIPTLILLLFIIIRILLNIPRVIGILPIGRIQEQSETARGDGVSVSVHVVTRNECGHSRPYNTTQSIILGVIRTIVGCSVRKYGEDVNATWSPLLTERSMPWHWAAHSGLQMYID